MAGKSKSDSLTVLGLKKLIAEAQRAIASGEKTPPCKIACGFGLSLSVHSEHAGYWKLPYRLGGKQKTASLGVCNLAKPDLAIARDKAIKAKAMIADGIEPKIQKAKPATAEEDTFKSVALAWHNKTFQSGKWKAAHAATIMKRLNAEIFPTLGNRAVQSLRTLDLLAPLNVIVERGSIDLAKTCRQYITSILRYAVQTGRITQNPALDLAGAIVSRKSVHRPALPLSRLPELLERLANYKGSHIAKLATQFALLTGARSSEFRYARWDEFDFEKETWTIPEQRETIEGVKFSERGEKMNRERIIYLPRQAIEVLQAIRLINGKYKFVFNGQRKNTPISENTVNLVLQRMGYDTKKEVCLHGFRTMLVSSLNESGQFSPDAIERHIGHEGKDKIRGIYNRAAQYMAERRRLLQWWADYLDTLKAGFTAPDDFKPTTVSIHAPLLKIVAG